MAPLGEKSPTFRVKELSLPVCEGDSFYPLYELHYQPPIPGEREGTTTVKNKDGTSTIHHFNKQLLTSLIEYCGPNGNLKRKKCYTWDAKNWLHSIENKDSYDCLLNKKTYEYDRFGNPVVEVFTGDLTGNRDEESYTTTRQFSDDGRHLLLREATEDGKVISLTYLPNTNLVTAKFTQDRDRIILREFNGYDDCYNLIQTISDDGSGTLKDDLAHVTQRIITNYSLRQQAPFLHMPEWIETSYLENGQEKLLRKVHLTYDGQGNIAEEQVYDALGELAYTLHRIYNERGDLLSETNPMGQRAYYTYTPRGDLSSATNFSGRVQTTRTYDAKRRLRNQQEQGSDGIATPLFPTTM